MPVTRWRTIERSAQLSGAPFPPALPARFERVADDPAAVRAARHRAGQRDVPAAARRGRAGHPLHHPQPVDRDPRGLAAPRVGVGAPRRRAPDRLTWDGVRARPGRRCTAASTRARAVAAGPRLAAAGVPGRPRCSAGSACRPDRGDRRRAAALPGRAVRRRRSARLGLLAAARAGAARPASPTASTARSRWSPAGPPGSATSTTRSPTGSARRPGWPRSGWPARRAGWSSPAAALSLAARVRPGPGGRRRHAGDRRGDRRASGRPGCSVALVGLLLAGRRRAARDRTWPPATVTVAAGGRGRCWPASASASSLTAVRARSRADRSAAPADRRTTAATA